MNNKQEMIAKLRDEFNSWEELLGSMSDEQITAPDLPGGWSIKDAMAHLMEWQRFSIARVEAFRAGKEPIYPDWLGEVHPDAESDENTELLNGRIYAAHSHEPWPLVRDHWRNGFLNLVKLGEGIPERDLMEEGKYPWMNGYALVEVLEGTYEHHMEHREELQQWLDKH